MGNGSNVGAGIAEFLTGFVAGSAGEFTRQRVAEVEKQRKLEVKKQEAQFKNDLSTVQNLGEDGEVAALEAYRGRIDPVTFKSAMLRAVAVQAQKRKMQAQLFESTGGQFGTPFSQPSAATSPTPAPGPAPVPSTAVSPTSRAPAPTGKPLRRRFDPSPRIGKTGEIEGINLTPEQTSNFASRLFMDNIFNRGMTIEQAERSVLGRGHVVKPEIIRAVGERLFKAAFDEALVVTSRLRPDLPLGSRMSLAADLAISTAGSEHIPSQLLAQFAQERLNMSPEMESQVFRLFGTTTPTPQQLSIAQQALKQEGIEQVERESTARERGRLEARLEPAPGTAPTTLGGAVARQEAKQRAAGALTVPERAVAGERGSTAELLVLNSISQRVAQTITTNTIGPLTGQPLVNTLKAMTGLTTVQQQEARANLFQLVNTVGRILAGAAQTESEIERVMRELPSPTDTDVQYFGKLRASLNKVKDQSESAVSVADANNVLIPDDLRNVPSSIDALLQALPGTAQLTIPDIENALRGATDQSGNIDPQIARQILKQQGLSSDVIQFDKPLPLEKALKELKGSK